MIGKIGERTTDPSVRELKTAVDAAIKQASRALPGSGPDRHITPSQKDQAKAALAGFKAGLLGIATVKKDERMVYAKELADTFGNAGWSVVPYCVAQFSGDRDGVIVPKHTQGNMPDVTPLHVALQAMKIPHYESSVGSFEYPILGVPCELLMGNGKPGENTLNNSGINIATPVIFVGSKD